VLPLIVLWGAWGLWFILKELPQDHKS